MPSLWNIIVTSIFLLWLFGTVLLLWQLGIKRMNTMEDALTRALDKSLEQNAQLSQALKEWTHETH